MKTRHKIFTAAGILGLLPFIFYGFMYMSAKESRDCSQMVIDSYEVRSGIDIPDVKAINCYYDAEKNLRVSVYELQVPSMRFVSQNKLTNTTTLGIDLLKSSRLLNHDELPGNGQLFVREGSKWHDQWQFVVEKETNRLWVEVLFAD